jgi:hypothetical protein
MPAPVRTYVRLAIAALGLATVLPLAGSSAAAAKPHVAVDDVVTGEHLGRHDECLASGSVLLLQGEGFVAHANVRFGARRARADAHGRFTTLLTVRTAHAQERVSQRFSQAGGEGATLRYWVAVDGPDVPSWDRVVQPIGAPGKVEQARVGGLSRGIGRPLYVHYLIGGHHGRQVFAQRVGTVRGPCGAAEFRLTQFPFAPVEPGLYAVDFGTSPTITTQWIGYRWVRIGPPPEPAIAPPGALLTVAGSVGGTPGGDGGPATAAALAPALSVAPLPDGGFLVADARRVRRVDPSGQIATVAGTGARGSSGDGGPATSARLEPSDVSPLPDGAFLVADCAGHSVRRVGPDGIITTVARGVGCPDAVAALPDSGLVVADQDNWQLLHVAPDGRVSRLAGTGEVPSNEDGGPALSTALAPHDVVVLDDGSLLIADNWANFVYRLADGRLTPVAGDGTEGARPDGGVLALDASITPVAVAERPGGGFYVVDLGNSSALGSEPRLRLVQPDGRIFTVAGTGRFAPDPTRSDELRGDGMLPPQADLRDLHDVGVLADGGVIVTEGLDSFDGSGQPGLVRYLPPPSGGMLAVAVRRDRDRIFDPDRPAHATVALTGAADVTVSVSDGRRQVAQLQAALGAGESRLELPPLARRPHTISISARDASGRVAADRAAHLPRGWLALTLARATAHELAFTVTGADSISGDGILGCRRMAAGRVDCSVSPDGEICETVASVRLGADGRMRWSAYNCPIRTQARPRLRLRRVARADLTCEAGDTGCPPPVFGVVSARWLVPWD